MDDRQRDLLRRLPSVEELTQVAEAAGLAPRHPRSSVVSAGRRAVAEARERILAGDLEEDSDVSALVARMAWMLQSWRLPHLRRVINASGVIVHTNLGRSLLADEAVERAVEAASRYSNLEYELETGGRGSRHDHVADLLAELTQAEAALAVNNNAAAVLLMLTTMASGRDVLVSRGQLVEIGGSFRIPDIMRLSGARLVEVGTTNKTRLADFEGALSPETALLLRVHTSNFKIVGFTEEVAIEDLARLGASRGVPVADDAGSGALADIAAVADEPSVPAAIKAGVDVVTFSGDKLLGGPQAGLMVGRRTWIDAMKQHPLARAVRVDKMTLAALEATLLLYREPERAVASIPTLRFLTRQPSESRELAERLAELVLAAVRAAGEGADALGVDVEETKARAGGGALPLWTVPSWAVVLTPKAGRSAARLEAALRAAPLPVVSRVSHDRVHLVVAALQPDELEPLAESVGWATAQSDLAEG